MNKIIARIKLPEKYPTLCEYIEEYCCKCKNNCKIPSIEMFSCIMKKVADKSSFGTKQEKLDEEPITLKNIDDRIIEHKEKSNRKAAQKNRQDISHDQLNVIYKTGVETDD